MSVKEEGETKHPKVLVNLDNILENEVGSLGKYQLVTLFLAAFPIIFSIFGGLEYIFTTARINTRCLIPECDGAEPQWAPEWVLNAIPGTSTTSFESCERFASASSASLNETGVCPASLFDRSRTQECDDHVYQNQLTVVYDFNLACQEWRRSVIGSIRTIGTLLGLPVGGYVSDRWGRRVILVVSTINTAVLGVARAFVNSYDWFLALEVIEAFLGTGTFSASYILVTELVGPKYRVIMSAAVFSLTALGQMTLGLIAWGVPAWRTLTLVLYIPQFLIICYFWILTESVRWLLSKGRYEESEQILKKVAKVNKKELTEKSLQALHATAESSRNAPKLNEPWLPLLVLKSRAILSRCLVTPVWWITFTLVYYGMNVNAVNLVGNSYLNYVVVSAIEIPGYWTAVLLLDRVGRKPVLFCGYWLCAACQFGFAFLAQGNAGVRLALYLLGKYCIAIVMTSMYMYTMELYPTRYRHNLFAFSSMIGRLGSITAPLTPVLALEVWEALPSVLFGSFALLSGALIFTTPETLGTKLPDTFEEAEQLGKKKANS